MCTLLLHQEKQEQPEDVPKALTEIKSWHWNKGPDYIDHLGYTFPLITTNDNQEMKYFRLCVSWWETNSSVCALYI